jgi:hypothetical protein
MGRITQGEAVSKKDFLSQAVLAVNISCGGCHTAVVDKQGKLFLWFVSFIFLLTLILR